MKHQSRFIKFDWRSLVIGLSTMLAMYILCYPLRYLAMLSALEASSAAEVTGTQLIEKAATTPWVVFFEVLTLIPIFGFSTWKLIQAQRTSNYTTVFIQLSSGLLLFGPVREIAEYPAIAAIEISAASLITLAGRWFSIRRLHKASNDAVAPSVKDSANPG